MADGLMYPPVPGHYTEWIKWHRGMFEGERIRGASEAGRVVDLVGTRTHQILCPFSQPDLTPAPTWTFIIAGIGPRRPTDGSMEK